MSNTECFFKITLSTYMADLINNKAKELFNINYVFPYQRLVISNILRSSGFYGENEKNECINKQLVLLPTGAGKSLCFMLPGIMLDGITVIIFPLLSLMADQERRIKAASSTVVTLKGGMDNKEWKTVKQKILKNQIKFIITNPETLETDRVIKTLKAANISHIVIDESHTVSEWGESFRPSYIKLGQKISELDCSLITAFTATASNRIIGNIKKYLFKNTSINIVRGNPDRTNIHYAVIPTICKKETLISLLHKVEYPVIIFHSSRVSTEIVNNFLINRLNRDDIVFYHAGLQKADKNAIENWFYYSNTGILNSTTAYGMGIDKQNIKTVIHYDIPATVEAYLQESGRAGRDRSSSKGIILKDINSKNNQLLNVLKNNTCRRTALLSLLNSNVESCSGCDVCDKTIILTPLGYKQIIEFYKKNNNIYSLNKSAKILKGYFFDSCDYYGFGILRKWDIDSIKEAILNLINTGILKKSNNPLYRGCIKINKKVLKEQNYPY